MFDRFKKEVLSHITLPVVTSKFVTEELPEHVDREVISYIRKNLKKTECNKYRPIGETEEAYCACGRLEEEHDFEKISLELGEGNNDPKVSIPTDAFGEINFGSRDSRQFLRLSDDSSMPMVVDFMKHFWKLEKPNILISVTGGAQNFVMKPKLKDVFRQGFIKAAQSTGAWIITGGMNAGVMKHIGEAIKYYTLKHGSKYSIPLIGVAPWGCVLNRDCLIGESGKWPAKYTTVAGKMTIECPLDPNHTHFLLIDNGSVRKYGTEIEFRAELERSISNSPTYISSEGYDNLNIPIVCVVLEGGVNTIKAVKNAIVSGTPCIVVQGSGRAADILAYIYNNAHVEEITGRDAFGRLRTRSISILEDWLKEDVKVMITNDLNIRDGEEIEAVFENLKYCVRVREYLTVFKLDGKDTTMDIDVTILTALLKSNKSKRLDQMKLALAWNRADIVKEQIYTDDSVFEPEALYKLMYNALTKGKVEFVKVLLERGLSLREFCTVRRVINLFNEPLLFKTCKHLKKYANGGAISFEHVGLFIRDLVGGFYEPTFCKSPWKDINPEDYLYEDKKASLGSKKIGMHKMKMYAEGEKDMKAEKDLGFQDPGNILFFWCIFNQMKEMAMLFLDISTEDIATSLTAQHLLKSLHQKDQDTEYAVELLNQTEYFGRLAVGILNECYINDPTNATILLVRQMDSFGDTTVLKMAVKADNKEFVAHPACQNLLTYIWTDKISEDNNIFKLIVSLFLPFLSPLLIKFRNIDIKPVEVDNRRKKEKKKPSFIRRILPRKKDEPVRDKRKIDTTNKNMREGGNFLVTYLRHMRTFMNAPCITFCYNCMAFIAFLILYAVILLTNFYPPKSTHPMITIAEIILYIWVCNVLCEKIRQFIVLKASTYKQKVKVFLSDGWNVLDLMCVLVFLVGVILRFIPLNVCRRCFYAGRIVLAFNIMMFFGRILHMFSVHQQLGPKLVMIKKMMWDLFYFVIIIMVFISAYGITSNVILFPNQLLNIDLIKGVFGEAWWSVYGSMDVELVTGGSCSAKHTEPLDYNNCNTTNQCPAYTCAVYGLASDRCWGKAEKCVANHWVVPILLAFYALITNVMMLNLLIAMFSNTFATIQGQTNIVWKMQRYHLIQEFESRPMLPPPLIFIGHIYKIFEWMCFKRCCSSAYNEHSSSKLSFKMKISKLLENKLKVWENIFAEEYLLKSSFSQDTTIDYHVKETYKKSNKIISKLDDLSDCSILAQTANFTVSNKSKLTPMLEKRFLYIEEQLRRNIQSFKTLFAHLEMDDGSEEEDKEDDKAVSGTVDLNQTKEIETEKFQKELQYHAYSRSVVYPADVNEKVLRYPVPDNKVDFKVEFPMYKPVDYTSSSALSDNLDFKKTDKMTFNDFDQVRNFDRRSRVVDRYDIVGGFPLNPKGRTGMRMRGVLKRWGPNPLYKLLLTRWGKPCTDATPSSLKPLRFLEFFSVPAPDGSDKNSIPELMYPRSCILPTECLNQYFKVIEAITYKKLLSWLENPHDEEVTEAFYFDDPRNTDNAWIEYTCQPFHDQDGTLFKDEHLNLTQEEASTCFWKQIDNHMDVYSPDMIILKNMADTHKAPY